MDGAGDHELDATQTHLALKIHVSVDLSSSLPPLAAGPSVGFFFTTILPTNEGGVMHGLEAGGTPMQKGVRLLFT